MFTSIDPATGAITASYTAHTPAEIEGLIASASTGYEHWRSVPLAERCATLLRLADLLEAGLEQYARAITIEMGKPITQARGEVAKCAAACRHYAENAASYLASRPVLTEAERSYVRYDATGPVLAIMPWNFPFWQVIRMLAPITAGGNALLVKPAPTTMGTGETIAELCREAGMPAGVVQTLRAEPAVVGEVIADPRIVGVTFTGSTRGGRAVAAIAGAHGKRSVLELGGSDPFVVLEDADLQEAARVAAASRLFNGGQSCIAAKRFIVVETVADAFLEAFATRIRSAVVGDPQQEVTTVGPMARDDLRDQLAHQVERSVAAGATVVVAGGRREGPGYFFEPALLADVDPTHPIGCEETFGPVAAVIVAADEADAVAVANGTEYGLGASVWTLDLDRGERVAARIEAGMVSVNAMVASDPRLPFGGVKSSGYGRELASEGIREFMNTKSVWVSR